MSSEIFILVDYRWIKGELISSGKKNNKVKFRYHHSCSEETSYIKREKCANPNELIVVVWDMGSGRNGRGSYRIEREKYPNDRIPANQIKLGEFSMSEAGFIVECGK